jgi:hypothetical protein
MQQKFVDHNDFDHLIDTLLNEFKPLFNKIKKIENRIKFTNGTPKNDFPIVADEIWLNPVSKIKWSIYYDYSYYQNKINIHFYPITQFNSDDNKIFLLLAKSDQNKIYTSRLASIKKNKDPFEKNSFRDFISTNNLLLKLFRGHFIDQFRIRANNPGNSILDVLHTFTINDKLLIVEDFRQNEKWLMYLNFSGIAMVQVQNNYLIFDTFIAKDQLKEDQIFAISNHLKCLDDKNYGTVSLLLLNSELWMEFIDKDRLRSWFKKLFLLSPESAASLINQYSPVLNKLYS